MSKIISILLLLNSFIFAIEVPIEEVEYRSLERTIQVNSQIIQSENTKASVSSRLAGKVTKYFVKVGQNIKKGQAIATIESLELSDLSAELLSVQSALAPLEENYRMTKKLYHTGVESLQNLNLITTERNILRSKVKALKSRLKLLGVKNGKIQTTLTLYAQNSGRISDILVPLESMIDAQSILVKITPQKGLMVKSFVPLKYANQLAVGNNIYLILGTLRVHGTVAQILPELDKSTQQIEVLSNIDDIEERLFVNAFVESQISLNKHEKHLVIKKSALSFYNNEWVVFVPKKDDHHDDDHDEHNDHDEHEHHDHEEEEEVPFEVKVVKIISYKGDMVAILGLKEHEKYVGDKGYYIKSLLLKSSMGGHGH